MYISVRSLCACPACFEFLSSKMARRRDSSIFSSGKTHSRVPTIFFSSNKRKSEYLSTVLEQSLLLTRWHQKECAHMNKTCTARSYQRHKPHRRFVVTIQEMVNILRTFIKAERTANWELHLQAVSEMLPYLAASGHNLYVKCARLYLQSMSNLRDDHPAVYRDFVSGLHVVRRSESL